MAEKGADLNERIRKSLKKA